MRLRVLSAAEDEWVEAASWYEDRQSGLGDRLIDDYANTVLQVLAAPESYPRMETTRSRRNLRRAPLKRFPYYVAFEIHADEIVILAFAHGKRRPNYWVRRR